MVPPKPFTYKLEEGRENIKTIKQLISEFHTRAEEEVTAAPKAHLLHKRQNVQAPNDDSKKSSCAAETDVEETPQKKQIKSTPSTAKPPPSAAVGRAPKGTGIDEIKGLDDDVGSKDAGGNPVQAHESLKDEKSRGRSRSGSEGRSPHGSCSLTPPGDREFILVTGSMMDTEVETRTTDLIKDLIILMTMTGTVLTTTGTVMTGFTTLTAGIMAGVTTGNMMTGVHTGHGFRDRQDHSGSLNVMLTIMTAADLRVLILTTGTITERDVANLLQSRNAARVVSQNIRSEIEEFQVVYL